MLQEPERTSKPVEYKPWPLRMWQRFRQAPRRDVVIGEVGADARNVVIGKNNVQINVAGHRLSLPIWFVAIALSVVGIGVLVIGGLLAYPFVQPLFNPSRMTGGMNIAVAEFGQIDHNGRIQSSALGVSISQTIYDKLELEYQENYPDLLGKDGRRVQIWHDSLGREVKNVHFGLFKGATYEERATQAAQLAANINAHMVIYGNLVQEENQQGLQLEIYYAGTTLRGEPDTVTGRHLLGQPLYFPNAFIEEPMVVLELLNEPINLRARVLFWVTVALILDATDQQELALLTLQQAQQNLATWQDPEAQALLHYFVGREAYWLREYELAIAELEKAKRLKPNYANAYITLGAVYYDRAQLFYAPSEIPAELAECISNEHRDRAAQSPEEVMEDINRAIEHLERAVTIAPDSPWPPIEYPARLTLGHTYRLKGQAYLLAAEDTLAMPWFEHSLQEFDLAEQAFATQQQKQYLAWTYLGAAATYFLQAQSLATIPPEGAHISRADQLLQIAALLAQAEEGCQRCLDEGKDVADQVYRKQVLQCGCEYLQELVRAAQAEVVQLMEEQ